MSIAIKLAIVIGIVVLLLAGALLWDWRKSKERTLKARQRGLDRMIVSEHANKETGRWNIS